MAAMYRRNAKRKRPVAVGKSQHCLDESEKTGTMGYFLSPLSALTVTFPVSSIIPPPLFPHSIPEIVGLDSYARSSELVVPARPGYDYGYTLGELNGHRVAFVFLKQLFGQSLSADRVEILLSGLANQEAECVTFGFLAHKQGRIETAIELYDRALSVMKRRNASRNTNWPPFLRLMKSLCKTSLTPERGFSNPSRKFGADLRQLLNPGTDGVNLKDAHGLLMGLAIEAPPPLREGCFLLAAAIIEMLVEEGVEDVSRWRLNFLIVLGSLKISLADDPPSNPGDRRRLRRALGYYFKAVFWHLHEVCRRVPEGSRRDTIKNILRHLQKQLSENWVDAQMFMQEVALGFALSDIQKVIPGFPDPEKDKSIVYLMREVDFLRKILSPKS
jgi:hypothetical protein